MNELNPTNTLAAGFVFISMFGTLATWSGSMALYVRTRSSWPHALRIWMLCALCNTCIFVAGIPFAIALLGSTSGRAPTPFLTLGIALVALGALGLMSWGHNLYFPARRQYGGL